MTPLDDARRTLDQSDALLERRKGDRRRHYIGDKTDCPKCGHPVSVVLPNKLKQPIEGAYIRHRVCSECHTRYETEERATRIVEDVA